MKCTAGLHHPLRRHHDSVQSKMHGFVNVLVAGVLAQARDAREDLLAEVLAEEDPVAFAFTPQGLGWRGHGASISEIPAARRSLVSFRLAVAASTSRGRTCVPWAGGER